ncbi:uncharacterized protein PADG_07937 [Paracoccidioides brasiliensis Pb18]|uniref:Uncharacterized protein n=2 Tax=Paracoccidioides brasiliensis TaxID=121759 RepID=C1GKT0_PARBD|nr:uncharacterized protein PADG_07937 [Paracoccidioides brasiliensis Pb18]EEH43117.2 hypothetical protein PADG_07937 [Paracoccidioides brasiliensis Pb18]
MIIIITTTTTTTIIISIFHLKIPQDPLRLSGDRMFQISAGGFIAYGPFREISQAKCSPMPTVRSPNRELNSKRNTSASGA